MKTKPPKDSIPLTDLKTHAGRVVKQAEEAHRPVVLTRRGRRVAVVQALADYEKGEEERAYMRAVVQGLGDLEAGREISISEVREQLKLK